MFADVFLFHLLCNKLLSPQCELMWCVESKGKIEGIRDTAVAY